MIKIASPVAGETRAVITFRCPCSPSHIYTKQLLGDCCSRRQVSAITGTQRPNVSFTLRITFRPALYKMTVSCHHNNKGHMPEATNIVKHSPSLPFCGHKRKLWFFEVTTTDDPWCFLTFYQHHLLASTWRKDHMADVIQFGRSQNNVIIYFRLSAKRH